MMIVKIFEDFKVNYLESMLKNSEDWIASHDRDLFKFRSNYIYKNNILGYKYVISKYDSDGVASLAQNFILYRYSSDMEFDGFVDYANTPINKYHRRFQKRYESLEGVVHFMRLNAAVANFFNDLPSEEDVEDWFIYLEDAGFGISSIESGFLDSGSESGIHNQFDFGAESPSIFIKIASENINIDGIKLDDVSINDEKDWKGDMLFSKNNPKLINAVNSSINRSSFYLGKSSKDYKGCKIKMTSWGWVWIVLEFKFDNSVNKYI